MIIRGLLTSLIDGVVRIFSASGRYGESFDMREFLQHYGFASSPKSGAELIIVIEGNVITCIGSDDRRYRLSLADGEAALYDWQGQKVHLKANKEIEISGCDILTANANISATITSPLAKVVASTQVEFDTPLIQCNGDVTIAGGLTCAGTYGESGGGITTPGNITTTNGKVQTSEVISEGALTLQGTTVGVVETGG
jgi:phage gp45-like